MGQTVVGGPPTPSMAVQLLLDAGADPNRSVDITGSRSSHINPARSPGAESVDQSTAMRRPRTGEAMTRARLITMGAASIR